MAKLIVIQSGREKSFDLIDDIIFIGSGGDCAIRIQGEGIVDRHCQVLKVEGVYRLIDLGGGTIVNGQPSAQCELANGDVIHVGNTTLTFRGGVLPAQDAAPAAAASPRPAGGTTRSASGGTRRGSRPASRGGGGRRPRRAGARRGGGSKHEIHVDAEMEKTAGQREVLKRRNVRKAGLSGPATAGIAIGVVVVVVLVGMQLFKGFSNPELGQILADAERLIANSQPDEARELLLTIPEDASNYKAAQKMLKDLDDRENVAVRLKAQQHGEADYQNNLLGFIQAKIETDNPKYKGDTAYIRIIVVRLENFLKEFPGNAHEKEVKSFLAKYKAMVPDTPPTMHEVYIAADVERARQMYGRAYVTVTDWMAAHPSAPEDDIGRMEWLRDKILRGANDFWKWQNQEAEKNILTEHYTSALGKYKTAVRRFKGIPEMERMAQRKVDDLKKSAEELVREK